MKLTERSREELIKTLELIDTICTLASANFPSDTDVVIETSGCRQVGKIRISSHMLRIAANYVRAQLLLADRSALNEEAGK